MIDLVYTDRNGIEQGIINAYGLDLAYGSDENDFELTLPIDKQLDMRSFVYLDGTEWGGIVRGGKESTLDENPVYVATGKTWHGILASTFVCPASGEDYVTVSGEANAVLGSVLEYVGLADVFDASSEDSGIEVSHRFERFTDCYSGIRKMLNASGAKLKIDKQPGCKPTLYAAPISSYVDTDEACRYGYKIEWGTPVNHLICLGKGELSERTVIHLYADSSGNVSRTQTLFGLDEVQEVYDYSSAEESDLIEDGTAKLLEMQETQSCNLSLPEDAAFDVDDVVGVVSEGSGRAITSSVAKVIVKIGEDGIPQITNEIGETSKSSSSVGSSGGSSGGGASYTAGDGISIVGGVISADVTEGDLDGKADKNHAHSWGSVTGKPDAFPPDDHDHDGRYYTESETDSLLEGKSDAGHAHGWSEVTGKPASYPPSEHNHAATDITSGTLPIVRGGTGKTTDKAAQNAILGNANDVTSGFTDEVKIPVFYVSPNDESGAVNKRTVLNLWNYIAGKIRSAFGFSSSNVLPVSNGGTGATTAAEALAKLGLTATAAELNKLDGVTATTAELNYCDGVTGNIQTQLDEKAASQHTHNYAGSSSAGGAATSANKLNTNAGDANTPVYFSNGVPKACESLDLDTSGNAATATKATQDGSGQNIADTYIKSLSASGKTITYTKGDGDTGTLTTQDTNTTYSAMTGATSGAAGKSGLVPAPAAGKQASFLRGDGSWAVPANTVYTHPTTAGNKHIPAGGSSGQILRWSADGTAVWGADNSTTYDVATSSKNGLMSAADKAKLDAIQSGATSLKWQDVYPVGAIYQSFDPTSPAALFGGSWTQITGRFLYCTTNTGAGGSNSHTLTTAQLPKNKAYSSANVNGNAGFSDALYTGAFTQGSEYAYLNLTYIGGGSSHNNMPSYQGVYAWRRTA